MHRIFGRRAVAALTIAAILTAGSTASAIAQSASLYGINLVTNGGAEADVGAPDSSHVVKPTGWTTTGQFTAVQYGASGGFPDTTSPGPADRGKNDFEGGNVASSTATQSISLAPIAADINSGSVRYTFSAWLGGYSNQRDNGTATVSFTDAGGKSLGSATLGPVTPQQRNDATGLVQRSHAGVVPAGASSAVVTIVLTRLDGVYNDGSADDVSLVLQKAP
jgi:hypothetical protein